MSVSVLWAGNDNDLQVEPFVDSSTGEAIDNAQLFATVCYADSTLKITNATNATPIVITTESAHGLTTGDYVSVVNVGGNTAARGTWQVTVLTATTFSLDTSVGNGAYTRGGRFYKAFEDAAAREIELVYDAGRYLGVLSGAVGLVEQSRYAVVFYATADYRDQYCQVDVATAQVRSGNSN